VVFFVRDNGLGIDARHHDRVFGLFDRLDSGAEGTGVGLAIVKLVMDKHDGRVWAESTPGAGSKFSLAFPERAEIVVERASTTAPLPPA